MRRNILVAVILLAITPTVLIGYIADNSMYKSMKSIQENSLTDVTGMIAENINRIFARQLEAVKKDTEDAEYKTLLSQNAHKGDQYYESLKIEVRKNFIIQKDTTYRINIICGSLIDSKGNIVASTDTSLEGLSLKKTKLYQSIMNGSDSYSGTVVAEDGTQKMELAVPIYDDHDKVIGILRYLINLDFVFDSVNGVQVAKTGYVVVLRKEGPVIQKGNQNDFTAYLNNTGNTNGFEKLETDLQNNHLKKKSGIIETSMSKRDFIGAYQYVPNVQWIIVSVVPRDEIYSELEKVKSVIFAASFLIGILAIIIGYLFARKMTDAVTSLNINIKKITNGDLSVRCVYSGKENEYREISEGINKMADSLQKYEKELRMAARIDSLTHLPNRETIYEILETLLYKYQKQAILIFNLDGFKAFNDNLNYEIGDKILCEVGDILRRLPQKVCYPSRIVGDEFLIFVNNWEENNDPEKIAGKIIKDISSINFIDDIRVHISASMGIEYLTEERMEINKLIKRSCIAMAKAKDLGKNNFVVYSRMNNINS